MTRLSSFAPWLMTSGGAPGKRKSKFHDKRAGLPFIQARVKRLGDGVLESMTLALGNVENRPRTDHIKSHSKHE